MLVENHYKHLHQVQEYANLMFKSPKTLSNLFAKYSEKTPLQVISERIFLRKQAVCCSTPTSRREIGYDLGFGRREVTFLAVFQKNGRKSVGI
ncbi:MAG: helix-turn-helix transcriptional regulator [Haliscomenobacter sp.]|nr:hypothetical protein [Haliscomenobacter sp.]MBK9488628.1 helix-turn-helix transcriptional regulator [Haliscomenobacter sp.]